MVKPLDFIMFSFNIVVCYIVLNLCLDCYKKGEWVSFTAYFVWSIVNVFGIIVQIVMLFDIKID